MADRSRVDALEYHERTKHSPQSIRQSDHRLDFDTKPTPYKIYEELPTRSLTDDVSSIDYPALAAVAEPTADGALERRSGGDASTDLDREAVAALCHYAAGITKTIERSGREHHFRAAAATGALYHVDLYLVCGELGVGERALEAGVYHYDPQSNVLDVLREGDFRGMLASASAHDAVGEAPLTVVTTSTWWRNAWKYRERAFRHAFWDSGTVLANLLAVAHALDYRAEVVTGFADDAVADLLGVDPEREAPLELVPIGSGAGDAPPEPPTVEPIDPETAPLSAEVREYPLIHAAWRGGALEDSVAATEWRTDRPTGTIGTRGWRDGGDGGRDGVVDGSTTDGDPVPLEPVDHETASSRPLSATVRRRGSCREYEREAISLRKLSTVLDRAIRGPPLDVRRDDGPPLAFVDCYLIVNAVEDLESGAYQYHAGSSVGSEEEARVGETEETGEKGTLEPLHLGEYRREAGHLALDQRLGADAAACIYFLADIEAITDDVAFGDRGYRVAQLEAALTAGRLYLATYAHRRLGGTGLTFYDDLVTDFFAPRAEGQTPMFLYTIGRPA
ncbi:SagB family peptide dehydrogenase [Natronoglomus mannanivorans]|uniref:SagB family peptide dehydrogenase n=1 Tax=Natronoglomus mannanivorans TaxID=2979990 RepID=A0AAP2Z155_9EURY|nr:SagB family peptide dehydrogenase [Halobacteria archaeon AArc-xg1-1]